MTSQVFSIIWLFRPCKPYASTNLITRTTLTTLTKCSHFFSVSTQPTRNCVVEFLKKCLQHPFAPTLPQRAAQVWAPLKFEIVKKVLRISGNIQTVFEPSGKFSTNLKGRPENPERIFFSTQKHFQGNNATLLLRFLRLCVPTQIKSTIVVKPICP